MRALWLNYATGITLASIAVNAFDPFARESLELEFLRKRGTDTTAIDIDPENKCNTSCTPFLTSLHSCDNVVNGEIIDYTACLCKIATFNDLTRSCHACIDGLGNSTWTQELGLWLELCTATGSANSTSFVDSSGLPNGRGAGTNGGQGHREGGGQLPNGRGMGTNGGGVNLTISRSVVVTSGSATESVSGNVASMTSVAITSTSSVVPVSSGMKTYSVVSGVLGLSILSVYLLL